MDKPVKNILIEAGVWNIKSSLANFYVFTRVFQKKTLFIFVGIFRENMHTLWRYFQILILHVSQYLFFKFQHKFMEKHSRSWKSSSNICIEFYFSHCTKNESFPLRISSLNATKLVASCEFGHIY